MNKRPLVGELNWTSLKSSIEDLPDPKSWLNLSDVQKIHSQHTQKIDCLSAMIRKITRSDDVGDQIEVAFESLERSHIGKSKDGQFLSGADLQSVFEYLVPLPKFKSPLAKYKRYYEAVKELIKKIAGDDDPARLKIYCNLNFHISELKKFLGNQYLSRLRN